MDMVLSLGQGCPNGKSLQFLRREVARLTYLVLNLNVKTQVNYFFLAVVYNDIAISRNRPGEQRERDNYGYFGMINQVFRVVFISFS